MRCFPPLLCALFVLCTWSFSFATTKSQQVERYLGTYRYEHDRPVGTVKFIFQKAVLKRKGDGKRTYKSLLIYEPYFSNEANAGQLIGIQIVKNGQTTTIRPEAPAKPGDDVVVQPAKPKVQKPKTEKPVYLPVDAPDQPGDVVAVEPARPKVQKPKTEKPIHILVEAPTNDPVRPRGGKTAVSSGGLSLPDSAALALSIDETKQKITGWQGRMWQTVRPIWEFVMWIFNSLIILLICFGGLCRYVAKTAATESLVNSYGRIIVGRWIVSAHQNAAAMLLLITWVIAIVLLIDVFMWLVYLNLPVWSLVVIWFPILWLAEKLTSWIVPNIPVIGPGGEEHR